MDAMKMRTGMRKTKKADRVNGPGGRMQDSLCVYEKYVW